MKVDRKNNESATKIQALVRGTQQKQKYQQSKEAAVKIQATFRGRIYLFILFLILHLSLTIEIHG